MWARFTPALFIFLFIFSFAFSQNPVNLVPNPSFENFKKLPCNFIRFSFEFDSALYDWYMPTSGSTDIFSTLVDTTCYAYYISYGEEANDIAGAQLPRTGNVMSAIKTYGIGGSESDWNYREYLGVKLIKPLEIHKKYYAEMYVSMQDNIRIASNNISMSFTEKKLTDEETDYLLQSQPLIIEKNIITDTTNWIRISGSFEATKPYQYLTIGNFYDDVSTDTTTHELFNEFKDRIVAGYYVDDVKIVDCLVCVPDTVICEGSNVQLKAIGVNVSGWASAKNPDVLIDQDSILNITPEKTTSYYVYGQCDTISTTVYVNKDHVIDTSFCEGDTLLLKSTIPNATYEWQDGSGKSTYTVSEPGIYWVDKTINGCTYRDTFNVSYKYFPNVLPKDTSKCKLQDITLDATLPDGNYLWQDSTQTATYNVKEAGQYWLQVSANGCSRTDTIVVKVKECPVNLVMPNVITPNGDEFNPVFKPKFYEGIVQAKLSVFNRLGTSIFETDNLTTGWNGKNKNSIPYPAGTYYWHVQFLDVNGRAGFRKGYLSIIY